MKLIKVGAATLNQTPRDWENNFANIVAAIEDAKSQRVSVLCLPEMCITGYGLEDDLFCADVPDRALQRLLKITAYTEGIIVCVGLPIRFDNALYNATALLANGQLIGFRCKESLASDGIHYESRWFKSWPQSVAQAIKIPLLGGTFPIGDIHFSFDGVKIGMEVCEEAWTAHRPGTRLASKGVDIYLNPSASHFSFGKLNTRKNFVVDGSRAFGATYIYTNLVGNEAGRAIYDGGALIASGGTLVAEGKRFTYQNVLLTTAIVDVHTTKTTQVRTASFQPNVEGYNDGCVEGSFAFPEVTEKSVETFQEPWETTSFVKHEECTRALGLALMDYMRKSHTNGFVVSLSGGADSALVTYAVSKGIELGVKELGLQPFVKKFCPRLQGGKWNIHCLTNVIEELLITAYQPTENSGAVTREAASQVAAALNAPLLVFNVDPVFKEYLKIGEQIKGGKLTFEEDDLAIQNLQARVRSPSIWMLANMQGKLLLTTSNMSEAAVGYCTQDGDTAGCLAPISGLPKIYIREFLRWVETDGPDGIGPTPAMHYVNIQAPTAELRPAKSKQTDETDLMPYWLLHMIEVLVMKNRYTPVEVYQSISREVDYDNNQLIKDITKFFLLFSRNQWKRERVAPCFHMDDHNLDPKTWARMPILNSGYYEELQELQKFIK